MGWLGRLFGGAVGTGKALGGVFGVASVDPETWGGWDGRLLGPSHDADLMLALVEDGSNTWNVQRMVGSSARAAAFGDVARVVAKLAKPRDLVVLGFSGHGGSLMGGAERDGRYETLCFYDGHLLDRTVRVLLSRFAPGVRVALVVDACHGGGMGREASDAPTIGKVGGVDATLPKERPMRWAGDAYCGAFQAGKVAPRGPTKASLERDLGIDTQVEAIRARAVESFQGRVPIACDAILLAAASEDLVAYDGDPNGMFTATLAREVRRGWRRRSWREVMDAVAQELPEQRPVLRPLSDGGARMAQEPAFLA